MDTSPSPKQHLKVLYILFVILLLMVASLLTIMGGHRIDDYKNHHLEISKVSSNDIANQVNRFIQDRKYRISLFARDHDNLLTKLSKQPDDETLLEELTTLVRDYFPDYFSITIADKMGNAILDDFDGFIGQACQKDMSKFKANNTQLPSIHPNPHSYHFDVMSNTSFGLFFVSFHVDLLADILKAAQSVNHYLMLVHQEHQLIEVTSKGGRNKYTDRNNFVLTAEEQQNILHKTPIPNSLWVLTDSIKANLFTDYRQKVMIQMLIMFLIFFSMSLAVLMFTLKISTKELLSIIKVRTLHLKQANQQKNKLFSIVAHDLRSPFSPIIGLTQMVINEIDKLTKKDIVKANTDVNLTARHVLDLLETLLHWSRIQMDKVTISKGNFYLNDLAISNLNLFKMLAHEKQISLKNSVNETLEINADNSVLNTIIRNLISNAIKYTPSGGLIEISSRQINNQWQLVISDNGIGMTSRQISSILADQSKSTTGTNGEIGTGLGLSVCIELLKKHGSQLIIESKETIGSQFYFDVEGCLKQKIPHAHNTLSDSTIKNTDHFKILIVDDQSINRMLLGATIKKLEYDHEQAKNGKDALEKLKHDKYDLILTDIKMPMMDGFELLNSIKNNPIYNTIPVIAFTGTEADDLSNKGFDGQLMKPLDEDKLKVILEHFLVPHLDPSMK